MYPRSRIATAGAGVAAAMVLTLLPAAATPPKLGATYTGHVEGAAESQNSVSFIVSDNGKWVRRMRVGPWPLSGSCGSGGNAPIQSSPRAAIKDGKFVAHVVYKDDTGEVGARAKVTGTFLRQGKEKGVVTTHRISDSCDVSAPYRTHAQ